MHTRGLGCEGEVTKCTQEGWGARVSMARNDTLASGHTVINTVI